MSDLSMSRKKTNKKRKKKKNSHSSLIIFFSSRPDDQVRDVESNGRIIFQSSKWIHAGAFQRWKYDLPVGECERLSRHFPGVFFPSRTKQKKKKNIYQ